MRKGRADPADTAALIRRERPDVLVLTEVTSEAVAAVEREEGIGEGSPLPHFKRAHGVSPGRWRSATQAAV